MVRIKIMALVTIMLLSLIKINAQINYPNCTQVQGTDQRHRDLSGGSINLKALINIQMIQMHISRF